ncbi:MAG: HAMP domain-containing sensor histidine kinase [Solirubrobacterales bacterium]|nr:HAMP domain-containing sensor histidine kinase [Solirubrobacterales bacterium]
MRINLSLGTGLCEGEDLNSFTSADNASIRIVTLDGYTICPSVRAPDLGVVLIGSYDQGEYRIEGRPVRVRPFGIAVVQYARPLSDVQDSVSNVRFFLILGVVGGALLALLAGLAVARRAMSPIAALTRAAAKIEQTRDPGVRLPRPVANDEVSELASTLEGMLHALDEARTESEAMLERQRAFVADASHELRTPLTAILANLELLEDGLDGELGESAQSALRSSLRMRSLVADLLLLARADAGRPGTRKEVDIAEMLHEAAGELAPIMADHELTIDAQHVLVDGARDELHRLTVNLIENAVRHTPRGTQIKATVVGRAGRCLLTVEDDGPGVPEALRGSVFERFVRGGGDRSGSSGLGLSIVRAVAESHGGTVELLTTNNGGGARFLVDLPAAR